MGLGGIVPLILILGTLQACCCSPRKMNTEFQSRVTKVQPVAM